MTKYVKNELGAVHSVTDEHFENVLHETTPSGGKYLLHGWAEIKLAEAKKLAPELFGKPDAAIVYTSKELKEVRDRQEWERELAAEDADESDDQGAGDTPPAAETSK